MKHYLLIGSRDPFEHANVPELYELGEKYIALGKAMQSRTTSLAELQAKAWACGLTIDARVLRVEIEEISLRDGE